MKYFSIKQIMCSVLVASLPTVSAAVPLGFGDSVFLPGTTVAAEPDLAGTVINDDVQTSFIDVAPESIFAIGTSLQNRVVRSSLDGTLTFGPRLQTIFNNTGSNFEVDRLVLFNFGAFDVDVNFRTDSLGDRGPTRASRSADGNTLTFNYDTPLIGSTLAENPQEDSKFLSLNTDATAFSLDGQISVFARYIGSTTRTVRFDFTNIAVPTTAPDIPPVPVPASLVLLLSALGLGGALRFRKT